LVWSLPAAFSVIDEESSRQWSRDYLGRLQWLRRVWGLEGDALHDYSRLFRAPHVVRDGVVTRPLVIGRVSELSRAPAAEDVAAAAAAFPRIFEGISRPLYAASGAQPPAAQRIEGAASASRGLLYDLLARRGDVRSPHDLGDGAPAFIIRCPRAAHHSRGTGDDALLFTSHSGGPGWITCRHNGCAGLEPADWLRALGVTQRSGTAVRWFVNEAPNGRGIRLGIELQADDGAPMPYLRVSSGTPAWSAWRAADVEPPSDLDHDGDLGDALRELKGRRLLIESENGRTRRILGAPSSAAKVAA